MEKGTENTFFVHTTLIPYIYGSNELKTKPTQNSVKDLRNMGIRPDALVCRAPFQTSDAIKEKLSLFCSVPKENVVDAVDVKNVYQIPINLYEQHIDEVILKQFKLKINKANIQYWYDLVDTVSNLNNTIEIALVGKYTELHDAYISVVESLKHAGYKYNTKVEINWVSSEDLEHDNVKLKDVFKNSKGIIVPGGFGPRGIEGMIKAIKYARENKIPYLGLCLGMQLSVIEFARNVCGIENANSTEFDSICKDPIIDLMADQKNILNMGGTLRLGNYECTIKKDTLAYDDYKQYKILERHRHRYEFNNKYKEVIENKGMIISGINEKANLAEIVEIPNHPHFIACQFHPEFKSRPTKVHPLFDSFIKTSINNK
jgi:CTP synthase